MATFTNTTKNSASWSNLGVSAYLGYILTDDTSKILVGEDEDLYLVWNTPTIATNLTNKSASSFTNITKS
jgi:hypothetical protein